MSLYLLDLKEIDLQQYPITGGKCAHLAELFRVGDLHIPDGFCLTTLAYEHIVGTDETLAALLDTLTTSQLPDQKEISAICSRIRSQVECIAIPERFISEIKLKLEKYGPGKAYAIRSSATAEDLPTASFAGQQDTYLNISGLASVLHHISKCWASLFTERAVIYRMQNGLDHRKIQLAVIVQEMIASEASGIVFTADPVTGNRKITSIDAGFGLGEALVSGRVNADNYKVRAGTIEHKQIAAKTIGIFTTENGGTQTRELATAQQQEQVLTDQQILLLEATARKIEAHFGCPQDIEWCFMNGNFYIVQSRPVTTLFPIPAINDQDNHVYLSVGHQQMMTDALKPLGLSLRQLTSARPMVIAGGRQFVDVTRDLADPSRRTVLLNLMEKSDLLTKDAIMTLLDRHFIPQIPEKKPTDVPGKPGNASLSFNAQIAYDPELVSRLIRRNEASIAQLQQDIAGLTGITLLDFILQDLQELKRILFDPESSAVFMTAMNAYHWLNDNMSAWLNEQNVADILAQSVPDNITAAMGLDLMDVADKIRPYPILIDYLQHTKDEDFVEGLRRFEGSQEAYNAIRAFLDRYGMRCAGEIDITRPRWGEQPTILIPALLNNVKNFGQGAGKQRFQQGLQEALLKEKELLQRLPELPDGAQKVQETIHMIRLLRGYTGYREYPKYGIVCRYAIYRRALLEEATRLVTSGIIHEKEDIYYLTFEELREVVQQQHVDHKLISKRKELHQWHEKLSPPRVLTSDGEMLNGSYRRTGAPDGALIGLAVSAGTIEGRARVIFELEDADFDADDILVTPFTDPGWTPLFVSVKGLVTEVGGLMTHGAVIAREYGLPAVVGVAHATQWIKDGQRIRVNGTEGYVELL